MYRTFNLILKRSRYIGTSCSHDFAIFILQLVRKNGSYKHFITRYIKKCLRNTETGNTTLDSIFN